VHGKSFKKYSKTNTIQKLQQTNSPMIANCPMIGTTSRLKDNQYGHQYTVQMIFYDNFCSNMLLVYHICQSRR